MSQQETEFESTNCDGPKSSYTGYSGWEPHYNATDGQKLSGHTGISRGQRLALAIVSLCLWMFVLLALLGVEIWLSYSDQASVVPEFAPVVAVAILCVTVVVIVVNALFNRRR